MLQNLKQASTDWLRAPKLECMFSIFIIVFPIWWIGLPYWIESFSPSGAFEEQALTSISADNIRAGFLKNWAIADYGLNGPGLPLDKMFYTHFPSGPDLTLALLRTLELSESALRQIYILIALSSVPLLQTLLNKLGFRPALRGAIISFFLFSYRGFWAWTDHFVYAFHFPLLFIGVIGLVKILKKEKHGYLLFFGSLPASYATSMLGFPTLVMTAIVMSFFLNNHRRKLLFLCALSTGFLVSLHLLRNALVLGFDVASKEIVLSLGNRIFGNPKKLAVMDFFRENNIAWWGTNNSSLSGLWGMFRSLVFRHFGLIVALLIIIFRRLSLISISRAKQAKSREFGEFGVLLTLGVTSFVWYPVFPNWGKNYDSPLIFHTAALFVIVALVLYGTTKANSYKSDARDQYLIKLSWPLILFLLIIPSIPVLPKIAVLESSFSMNSALVIFSMLYIYVLLFQAFFFRFSVGKTSLIVINFFFCTLAIFLTHLIEYLLSRPHASYFTKVLFSLGLFFAINFIIRFYSEVNFIKLKTYILDLLVASLVIINCFLLFNQNRLDTQEARFENFRSSEVESFNNLPKLNGNIWTNLNAPLLFRYTGGLVNGYCEEKGLLEKNKQFCYSGRINEVVDPTLASYVVLSEFFRSGDTACFFEDPCFEKVKSSLALTHKKIDSPDGFYIFQEKQRE